MSKSKSKKVAPVATKQAAPVATPAPVETGRTIVVIARELKITPRNARRVARKHADVLGHAGKGTRWFLNADQEKALRDALTRELTREKATPAVAH